jgi:hypothetical protein
VHHAHIRAVQDAERGAIASLRFGNQPGIVTHLRTGRRLDAPVDCHERPPGAKLGHVAECCGTGYLVLGSRPLSEGT